VCLRSVTEVGYISVFNECDIGGYRLLTRLGFEFSKLVCV
jgi:hypothetical protein